MLEIKGKLVFAALLLLTFSRVSTCCPTSCSCSKWKNGKETTDCTNGNFSKIPENLPPTTQVLDLTGNKLSVLYDYTFYNKSLVNLQRLFMPRCNIEEIRLNALYQLSNLIELDLSYNNLKTVPATAFSGTTALRFLNMRANAITVIPAEAFTFTPSIVTLDISSSGVTRVEPEAFQALSMLESLRLHENRLKELPRDMIDGLDAVHNLEVHDNPWICDCRVLPLWRLLIERRVSHPVTPVCNAPTNLRGFKFDDLAEKDLACPPEILPGSRFIEGYEGENTSLTCRVWGEPTPRVQWYFDEKEISGYDEGRLVRLIKSKGNGDTVSNLVIAETKETDSGLLRCEAINPAGRASANFTLVVRPRPNIEYALTTIHFIAIAVGVLLLLVVLVVSCFICRKSDSSRGGESQASSPKVEKEREASPPTVVVCASPNPLQKPPRLTDLSNSNTTDPDLISHLANGYPITSATSSTVPGDYTRVEGDSLYPSGVWDENKLREQILHEHFNPGYSPVEIPRHDPVHSTPTRTEQVDRQALGYPADYGLPIPEVEKDIYSSQFRVSSPVPSNPNHMYDSRQELALYNSSSDIYNTRDTQSHKVNGQDTLSTMYEMMEVGKDTTTLHQSLHDSGHQDVSPCQPEDSESRVSGQDGPESLSSSLLGESPWVPGSAASRPVVPMGIPVLPPLPTGTLHRIKTRDSPDEGYQEGTEV